MDYITATETGWMDVVPELKMPNAMRIYGSTPPTLDELRDIAEHYCRLMVEAKWRLLQEPNLGEEARFACVKAFDRAIRRNAEFVARYKHSSLRFLV